MNLTDLDSLTFIVALEHLQSKDEEHIKDKEETQNGHGVGHHAIVIEPHPKEDDKHCTTETPTEQGTSIHFTCQSNEQDDNTNSLNIAVLFSRMLTSLICTPSHRMCRHI